MILFFSVLGILGAVGATIGWWNVFRLHGSHREREQHRAYMRKNNRQWFEDELRLHELEQASEKKDKEKQQRMEALQQQMAACKAGWFMAKTEQEVDIAQGRYSMLQVEYVQLSNPLKHLETKLAILEGWEEGKEMHELGLDLTDEEIISIITEYSKELIHEVEDEDQPAPGQAKRK